MEQSRFVLGVLGQMHGVVGARDTMTIDLHDHVAGLEAGFGRGRIGGDFGHDRALDVVGNVELLAGLRVEVG